MFASNHSLKYKPKKKLFSNSNGTNTFNGHVAISYGYYVYAIILQDGRVVEVEKSPSPTTSGHMGAFWSLAGVDYRNILRIQGAHAGLRDLNDVRKGISYSIAKLEKELLNKRNRNIESRKSRITELQEQLTLVDVIAADPNVKGLVF